MARKITKKAISEDLLFADDFDENKLDAIERHLNQPPAADSLEEASGRQGKTTHAEDEGVPSLPGEDLDKAPFAPASAPDDTAAPVTEQSAVAARMVRTKMLVLLAAGVLVVLIAGVGTYLLWPHSEPPPVPQMVRHPIVIPSYTYNTSFLLFVSAAGRKKELLKVDLELDFWSSKAHEQFKSNQVLYSDIIYKFLRKQQPPENSLDFWEKILEKDLFQSLKGNYPETSLNGIQVKNLMRL